MSSGDLIKRVRAEKILLPPLAGYTDYPYRRVLADFHVPLMCTEMVSSGAVLRQNPRTLRMLKTPSGVHLHGVQLFGDDPVAMAGAAESLESMGFDYIDINMGCAAPALIRNGAGVSLMGAPDRAVQVVSSVVDAVSVPVTCKIRLGETRVEQNALELSLGLVDAGAALITVHGRSGEKRFGEPVNHGAIREIVESVSVPVVANGGVYTGGDALEMLRLTGAAAVMPGRGLIGNPWIVDDVKVAYAGASYFGPSLAERKEVCLRHLGYLVDFVGERDGVVTMRRVLPRYFLGVVHATDLRGSMDALYTVDDTHAVLDRLYEDGDQVVYQRS